MLRTIATLSVVVAIAAAAPTATVIAPPTVYGGTFDLGEYCKGCPLNVTVTGNTAVFSWVYDKNAGGAQCVPDTETGLAWSVSAGKVVATGSGKDPSYYSFDGVLKGDTITGNVNEPGHDNVGTWTATLGKTAAPAKCKPAPGPAPPAPPHPTTHAKIWPLPSTYTRGTATLSVTPSDGFFVYSAATASPLLAAAFARYQPLTFPHRVATATATAGLSSLEITVDSADESHPQVDMVETYTLTVPADGTKATLHAASVWGVLRGLETFSQLVVFDFDAEAYTVPQAPWAIDDTPRFPHRGLMIDTARHYEPIRTIKEVIDSLQYAKLNVLHWHMSDTQSFPFQVKSYPKLWSAAWSEQEKFTQEDVAGVVEYARLRGVRVIVEFDMPGHAGSWCAGYPEICPSVSCNQPLNVANNKTFEVIEALLNECTGGKASTPGNPSPGLFKDNFIHLGGDEVNTACWDSTPEVASWLAKEGLTADQGYAYFVKRAADTAIAQGHRPVQWSEVFDHFKGNLTKETIVHIWKSVTNVTEVVALGYQVLVNVGYDKLSWYLDNLEVTWDNVYLNEPCVGVPDELCKLVLGGHGEMWGETVDSSDIEQTVWPRLGAIAERLWSPRTLTDTADALDRIQSFRCMLNRRGVAAAPVKNSAARSAPPGPGGCYTQ